MSTKNALSAAGQMRREVLCAQAFQEEKGAWAIYVYNGENRFESGLFCSAYAKSD